MVTLWRQICCVYTNCQTWHLVASLYESVWFKCMVHAHTVILLITP